MTPSGPSLAACLALILGCATALHAQPPTLDGVINGTSEGYTLIANDTGGPGPGFGLDHRVNALYAYARTVGGPPPQGELYIGLVGRVKDGNRILIFMDTRAGGETGGDFGRPDVSPFYPGGLQNFNSGTTFDSGFEADYCLTIGTNSAEDNWFVDLVTLQGDAGNPGSEGPKNFIGDIFDAVVAANPDTTNGNTTTRGFEVRLTYNPTGTGVDFQSDKETIDFFVAYTGDSGFLSNQFLSPAGSSQGNFTGNPVNFNNEPPDPVTFSPGGPLLVELESFIADWNPARTAHLLQWVTSLEIDSAGFHVYAADRGPAGGWTRGERLTSALLPSTGDEFTGQTYAFTVANPPSTPDPAAYYLEELDLYGKTTLYGPAVVGDPSRARTSVPDWSLY